MLTKHQRIVQILEKHNLDGLIIEKISNFAWATDGAASYINTAATNGVGKLLITREAQYLFADNIEAPRFEKEEQLKEQGWEFYIHSWNQSSEALNRLTKGLKLGTDGSFPGAQDLSLEVTVERSRLDPNEQTRFRSLSSLCSQAMAEAIEATRPGMTEFEIAAALSQATQKRGVLPIVNLIATDERIYNFRHPLPTGQKMDKYAMLVLCGRQFGLVCSITRLVHYGSLPAELQRKAEAVAYVDAVMIEATRPGKTVADIFQITKEAYAKVGFADEWQLHHQGGPAGFDPREFVATEAATMPVSVGQAYAWNPSITGCKSEDTILIGDAGNEVLSSIGGWPSIAVEVNGKVIDRPAIKVIR